MARHGFVPRRNGVSAMNKMLMLLASASGLALAGEAAAAGHFTPRSTSTLLYDQSDSSGLAKYAVPSWANDSSFIPYSTPDLAADDFVIPGTGTHTVTAVYAAGVGSYQSWVNVIFFSTLKYNKQTGTTTAIVKATCSGMPFTDESGTGDLLVDVSSCDSGTFNGGHDYAVSVQPESPGGIWYWQTNRQRIGRPGFWYDYGGGGSGSCYTQLTPVKICFPTKGYGPDLAFAIYGTNSDDDRGARR